MQLRSLSPVTLFNVLVLCCELLSRQSFAYCNIQANCKIVFNFQILSSDLVNDNGSKMQKLGKTHEDVTGEPQEKCVPVLKDLSPSAVVPSLPLAIRWLRDYAKDNPSLHLQVKTLHSKILKSDQQICHTITEVPQQILTEQ